MVELKNLNCFFTEQFSMFLYTLDLSVLQGMQDAFIQYAKSFKELKALFPDINY